MDHGERLARLEAIQSEQDKRHEQRFADMERATSAALAAAEKSSDRTDAAAEKRFEGQNEFREQLKDQAATFITRVEAEALSGRNAERIQEMDARHTARIGGIESRLSESHGVTTGTQTVIRLLIAVAGLIVASVGVVVTIIITQG